MTTNFCFEKDIEKIENYELAKKDNFKGWVIHHRLELENSDGVKRDKEILKDELIALNCYYFRPASELIFMRRGEHVSLHNKYNKRGNKNTEGFHRIKSLEEKCKISASNKGKHFGNKSNFGKKFSEEHRRKISEAAKKRWSMRDVK